MGAPGFNLGDRFDSDRAQLRRLAELVEALCSMTAEPPLHIEWTGDVPNLLADLPPGVELLRIADGTPNASFLYDAYIQRFDLNASPITVADGERVWGIHAAYVGVQPPNLPASGSANNCKVVLARRAGITLGPASEARAGYVFLPNSDTIIGGVLGSATAANGSGRTTTKWTYAVTLDDGSSITGAVNGAEDINVVADNSSVQGNGAVCGPAVPNGSGGTMDVAMRPARAGTWTLFRIKVVAGSTEYKFCRDNGLDVLCNA